MSFSRRNNRVASAVYQAMLADIRYALRGLRRSPLFTTSVTATIGLGLGVLCSGFTIINGYVLKPIDLPDPRSIYEVSWDTTTTRRHRFSLPDFEALRDSAPHFSRLVAISPTMVRHEGVPLLGALVTGNFFQVLGARTSIGRTLIPSDAVAPGRGTAVVLSSSAWRSRFGSDPTIVGKTIVLRGQRFDVVGVLPREFVLPGLEGVGFFAPLTIARAFDVPDPWSDASPASLTVVGRLAETATASQARAWLDVWLHQRFPPGSESAPIGIRVESRATRIQLDGVILTLLLLILSAFGLVLLVACANVTNLVLARGFSRQREIAVRLSLGAARARVIRLLIIESLVLAVPAAIIGLALTTITARVFPALIAATIPLRTLPVDDILAPLDPDWRVISLLSIAAIISSVIVSLMPALQVTRANLVRASKGDEALDTRRSRLRTGLVGLQIAACVLFLVSATGLIDQSRRLAHPETTLSYERVATVRLAPRLRADLAARLASDPAIEMVGAAWRPPMNGPLRQMDVVSSTTRIAHNVGFTVVSPEYFPIFDIRVVRGRAFTAREADDAAPVAMVSEATARLLWPGIDPLGQTLDLVPPSGTRPERRPPHTSVRVIGLVQDVTNGLIIDGVDPSCVYFATGYNDTGELPLLVRVRGDMAAAQAAVTTAVNTLERDAPVQFLSFTEQLGAQVWAFSAFSTVASLLGVIGLLLAFSGTYAVVSFLVTQRTREFGIRMALGASVRQIVGGMMSETFRTAGIGLATGVVVAIGLTRAIGGTIPLIPPVALRPYVVGVTIVLLATAVASLLPSLRATRIDPSKALRVE